MPPSNKRSVTFHKDTKPFLKWVGGKQQLLSQLDYYFPANYDRYFEPFLGGGAVFFHLWKTNRLPKKVFLFDDNEELINVYLIIRSKLNDLISLLAAHQNNHNKEYFYQIRSLDRQDVALTDTERAARTIYLNRTCYNGLYRVNSNKQFNAPIGSYKNPQILYKDTLEAASLALRNTLVEVKDFREVTTWAKPGDFFYFDPPYDPVSKTASFTGYTSNSFGDKDQQDLARVFRELSEQGCLCLLSNSYTPFILKLYQKFRIEIVNARRAVNSNANRRGCVKEVVVLNY